MDTKIKDFELTSEQVAKKTLNKKKAKIFLDIFTIAAVFAAGVSSALIAMRFNIPKQDFSALTNSLGAVGFGIFPLMTFKTKKDIRDFSEAKHKYKDGGILK